MSISKKLCKANPQRRTVIPAKAGIQAVNLPSRNLEPLNNGFTNWIPAFAGMTVLTLFLAFPIKHLWAGQKTGATFLELNPSARTAALGGGGSAIVKDASAIYLNPSGIGLSQQKEIFISHSQGFFESSINAVSLVSPLKNAYMEVGENPWVLGLSVVYRSEGDLVGRGENGEKVGSFRADSTWIGFSASHQINSSLMLGTTLKGINERIGGQTASGYALDLGAQMTTKLKGLTVAASINNLGPSMKFTNEKFSLPTTMILGLGYQIRFVSFALDAKIPVHGGMTNFSIGSEFIPVSNVAVRLGYVAQMGSSANSFNNNDDTLSKFAGLGAGVGLRLGDYRLDYALLPNQTFDESHRVSLSLKF